MKHSLWHSTHLKKGGGSRPGLRPALQEEGPGEVLQVAGVLERRDVLSGSTRLHFGGVLQSVECFSYRRVLECETIFKKHFEEVYCKGGIS